MEILSTTSDEPPHYGEKSIYRGFLIANSCFTELSSCSGYPSYQKAVELIK
jgi:hypothetical protein